MTANTRIHAERLWQSIMTMAEIGATPKGGCRRLAFSQEDRRGRSLFRSWCEGAGLTVRVDVFGNMFARRPGKLDLPPVMIGSHLDTQPTGGKFDGVFGVLAGLEVIRTLNDAEVETERPIEVVNWTNEEGAIFRPMLGSEVFTGRISLADAYALPSPDGRTLLELLDEIGYRGETGLWPYDVHGYFEAHIEQGPILEAEGRQIGVVTDGIAFRRYVLTIEGREAHAGPTPMDMRHDAMVVAASVILAGTTMARSIDGARATFGCLTPYPGSPNTVAGRVDMTVDLRHVDDATLDRLEAAFSARIADLAAKHGVAAHLERTVVSPRVKFHSTLVRAVADAVERCGYSHREIVSGAGHDACNVARKIPTAMIFIPCKDGISHNEEESATHVDCEAGCNVLLHAVLSLANSSAALPHGEG